MTCNTIYRHPEYYTIKNGLIEDRKEFLTKVNRLEQEDQRDPYKGHRVTEILADTKSKVENVKKAFEGIDARFSQKPPLFSSSHWSQLRVEKYYERYTFLSHFFRKWSLQIKYNGIKLDTNLGHSPNIIEQLKQTQAATKKILNEAEKQQKNLKEKLNIDENKKYFRDTEIVTEKELCLEEIKREYYDPSDTLEQLQQKVDDLLATSWT